MSYTYTTLKAAIESFAVNTGAKFDAAIDANILALGEVRALRDLNLEIFDVVANAAFSANVTTITKPAGWVATRSLTYLNGTLRQNLLLRSYDYIVDYWPDPAQVDSPLYYCELNDTQWMVGPTPAGSVTGNARYMKRPTPMSASNTTTWLGTNAGDLLLKACMIESNLWMKNDTQTAAWKADYATALAAARTEFAHLIRNDIQTQGTK